jgi:hypothetical protein
MSEYSELLKDPRWQKKRLEILERDNWKCVMCGDDKSTLHVHHKWYANGLKPWEYKGPSLATLCCSCHDLEHSTIDDYKNVLMTTILSKGVLGEDLLDIGYQISCMSEEEFHKFFKTRKYKKSMSL